MDLILTIRPAIERDLRSIQLMLDHLANYERERYDSSLRFDFAFTDEATDKILDAIKNDIVLIALNDEWPVGYLLGKISYSAARKSKQLHIENVFVEEKFRRQQIGEKLISYCENLCKEKGVRHISVTILAKNKGAVAFYEKVGLLPRSIIYAKDI